MEIRRIGKRVKLYRSSGSVQTMIGSLSADDVECPADIASLLTKSELSQLDGHFRGTRERVAREAAQRAINELRRCVEMRSHLTERTQEALIAEAGRLLAELQQ